MWIRLAARYHFVAVSKPLVLYRISQTSMSANVFKQSRESIAVIEKAYSQAPQSLKHLKTQPCKYLQISNSQSP